MSARGVSTTARWGTLLVAFIVASGCALDVDSTTIAAEPQPSEEPGDPVTGPRKDGHHHPCAGAAGLDSERPFYAPPECVVVPPVSTGRPDPTDGMDPVEDTVLPGGEVD